MMAQHPLRGGITVLQNQV